MYIFDFATQFYSLYPYHLTKFWRADSWLHTLETKEFDMFTGICMYNHPVVTRIFSMIPSILYPLPLRNYHVGFEQKHPSSHESHLPHGNAMHE